MSKFAVMPLDDYISSCEAVREKTGKTNVIKSGELADEISSVYDAGALLEKELTWERITGNGARPYYSYAFAYADFSGYKFYKPIVPTDNIGQMFYRYMGTSLPQNIDLSQAATSKASRTRIFYYCTNAIEIDCMGMVPGQYIETFYNCRNAKKISGMNINEESTFENTFYRCEALEELNINGTIGQNGFDVSYAANLGYASIVNIIGALSSATTNLTVTLSLDAVNKAFETSEGANDGSTSAEWTVLVASKPNWTIVLA